MTGQFASNAACKYKRERISLSRTSDSSVLARTPESDVCEHGFKTLLFTRNADAKQQVLRLKGNRKGNSVCSKALWNGVDDKLNLAARIGISFETGSVKAIPEDIYFRNKRQNKRIRNIKKGIP